MTARRTTAALLVAPLAAALVLAFACLAPSLDLGLNDAEPVVVAGIVPDDDIPLPR